MSVVRHTDQVASRVLAKMIVVMVEQFIKLFLEMVDKL